MTRRRSLIFWFAAVLLALATVLLALATSAAILKAQVPPASLEPTYLCVPFAHGKPGGFPVYGACGTRFDPAWFEGAVDAAEIPEGVLRTATPVFIWAQWSWNPTAACWASLKYGVVTNYGPYSYALVLHPNIFRDRDRHALTQGLSLLASAFRGGPRNVGKYYACLE